MYTDKDHIKITDKGKIEGNVVFTYLDVFATDESFKEFLPEYKNLDGFKKHYQNGGLGDVKIKKFLNDILQKELRPIRERRNKLKEDLDSVYEILKEGTRKANIYANETLKEVKHSMQIDYF